MNSDFKELLQTFAEERVELFFLGKEALVMATEAAGRPQDLADLDELRRTD